MKTIHDPVFIEIIARLRQIRKERGLSQADVAKLLQKPQSYVSKIESCQKKIDLVETLRLCEVLDTRLAEVVPKSIARWL